MGGVDHSDQMRQYYDTSRRANKWWRYLLWFCLDVSIVNAHILMQIADNHPNFTQLQFRIEMVKMLDRRLLIPSTCRSRRNCSDLTLARKNEQGKVQEMLEKKKDNVLSNGMRFMRREVLLGLFQQS